MNPTRSLLASLLALSVPLACGGPRPAPVDEPIAPPPRPVPTELERRQAAACETLGPRLTACSIEDAKANLPPEKVAELDLERTAPVHSKKFIEDCNASPLSSRQVRVLEVCQREEQACEPLVACLDHLAPEPQGEAPAAP